MRPLIRASSSPRSGSACAGGHRADSPATARGDGAAERDRRRIRLAGHTFRDLELAGWHRKAGHWDDTLGAVTREAIAPLLDAVETTSGVRLLDIACGTGALAATAAGRGAQVVGIDFAPAMVAEAAGGTLASSSGSPMLRRSRWPTPAWTRSPAPSVSCTWHGPSGCLRRSHACYSPASGASR
jgi:hypothetical protein